MKKLPVVVTLPLIKSSNTIATEHPVASTLVCISLALLRPIAPAVKITAKAQIKTIAGQINSHFV